MSTVDTSAGAAGTPSAGAARHGDTGETAAAGGSTEGLEQARLGAWRGELGRSTRLWSGDGTHLVDADRWLTRSGAMAVDYNVACCYGRERQLLARSLDEVSASRRPSIIMVAGPALGSVSVLADAGWVCIGTDPFMRLVLGRDLRLGSGNERAGSDESAAARRLGSREIGELRAAMQLAFDMPADLAALALPDSAASDDPSHDAAFQAWGLFSDGTLVSGTALVRTETSVCVWSMATPPELQGRGYGRRLLAAALSSAFEDGASQCLLIASPAGEHLYRKLGFDVLEHWQLWTRPRWVLA